MKKRPPVLVYTLLWFLLAGAVFLAYTSAQSEYNSQIEQVDDIKSEDKSSSQADVVSGEDVDEEKTIVVSSDDEKEMKGVWLSFIALQTQENTIEAFCANYEKLVMDAKDIGANSLFVHVRPYSDALYESDYFPWSHILTGVQGKDPEFDIMEFMIETAHENGMEFHAWINPLRVKTEVTPAILSQDNPYSIYGESNPYYFIEIEGDVYLNPAYSQMRSLITDGVVEIVENYKVDGIHFDDYFYPYEMGSEDSVAYDAYYATSENPLSVEQWREANINALISQVYREIKAENESVDFGISPQGNINNNAALSADVYTWCSTVGYIDYIAPQLYFSYENPALGFTNALTQWVEMEKHAGLDVYIGLALYKAGSDTEDEGTWKDSDDIIARQIKDTRSANFDGVILYESKYITDPQTAVEVENIKVVLAQ